MIKSFFNKLYNKWCTIPDFIRFVLIGGVNTVIAYSIFAIALLLTKVAVFKTVILTIIANVIAAFIACGLFKLLNLDNVEKVEIVGIDEFIRK